MKSKRTKEKARKIYKKQKESVLALIRSRREIVEEIQKLEKDLSLFRQDLRKEITEFPDNLKKNILEKKEAISEKIKFVAKIDNDLWKIKGQNGKSIWNLERFDEKYKKIDFDDDNLYDGELEEDTNQRNNILREKIVKELIRNNLSPAKIDLTELFDEVIENQLSNKNEILEEFINNEMEEINLEHSIKQVIERKFKISNQEAKREEVTKDDLITENVKKNTFAEIKQIKWKGSKSDFARFVREKYNENIKDYASRADAVRKLYAEYEFDFKWSEKQCEDLLKKV